MSGRIHHNVMIDGVAFAAQRGALLLDAALGHGVALPHDCRAGHCGTCRVRVVSGQVTGGAGSPPGIVHACQSRISGDVVIETAEASDVRSVSGVLSALRPLSGDVLEVGITTDRTLPYLPGQYARLAFAGFPSRPFSITLPLSSLRMSRTTWFHIRRMTGGRVTSALGNRIRLGHQVDVTGPLGTAHFKPDQQGRLLLIGTSTGFAPIWSIAVAALRENARRSVMIIAGGRSRNALYMMPALARLARFPNVVVVPICSAPGDVPKGVMPGRPTDYVPQLIPTDVVYACGAPAMVDAVKSIAARVGAVCHADPFMATNEKAEQPRSRPSADGPLDLAAFRDLARLGRDRGLTALDRQAKPCGTAQNGMRGQHSF